MAQAVQQEDDCIREGVSHQQGPEVSLHQCPAARQQHPPQLLLLGRGGAAGGGFLLPLLLLHVIYGAIISCSCCPCAGCCSGLLNVLPDWVQAVAAAASLGTAAAGCRRPATAASQPAGARCMWLQRR